MNGIIIGFLVVLMVVTYAVMVTSTLLVNKIIRGKKK